MDNLLIQRKVFSINAVLLLVAVIAMAANIPILIQEVSPDGIPKEAPIATAVGMLIHLAVFLGFLYGIRQTRRMSRINREVNIAAAIALGVLGVLISDGGFAYWEDLRHASIGFFICSICDLLAMLVSVISLFFIKKTKKIKPAD